MPSFIFCIFSVIFFYLSISISQVHQKLKRNYFTNNTDFIILWLRRFKLKFDMLQSNIDCKLTELSNPEAWDYFDTTNKTIKMFILHLEIVRIIFINMTMPVDWNTFLASVFQEIENILDHKLCNKLALL